MTDSTDHRHRRGWSSFWRLNRYHYETLTGQRLLEERRKVMQYVLETFNPSNILDVGCGQGTLMKMLEDMGYSSCGLDFSREALEQCRNKANNTFLMNAKAIGFKDNAFGLVLSGGMLEHFEDPDPVVREMCRVGTPILLFQPNTTSLQFRIASLWVRLRWGGEEPPEYDYTVDEYEDMFSKHGFELINKGYIFYRLGLWLLFQKIRGDVAGIQQ